MDLPSVHLVRNGLAELNHILYSILAEGPHPIPPDERLSHVRRSILKAKRKKREDRVLIRLNYCSRDREKPLRFYGLTSDR